ncbi:MAG: thiol:disulfide interchange protein DsbA/DsbL [Gammaproteobacteria bacterium]|nr:thiol:disulfide interchange protein DsbA/DsbL [Gammaproteobacteria bacterium]
MNKFNWLLMSLLTVAVFPLAAQQYEAGKHYTLIEPAVTTQAEPGEVEVVEVFSYACPHCYRFQPHIDEWLTSKPDYVDFRRVAAQFNATYNVFARAFVTADMMGLVDQAHAPMFAALHDERRQFRSMENIADFYAEHGADKGRYLSTAESFAVATRMNKEAKDTRDYGIRGTPSLVVAGKYLISANEHVPTHAELIKIMQYLVQQEHQVADQAVASNE